MLQAVRSRTTLIGLMVILAAVVFACQEASGPTAPAAPEPSAFLSQSSADLAPPQFDLWATVMGEPMIRQVGDQRWVELAASCKSSPMGPEWSAVLMCPPDLFGKCAQLHPDSHVQVGCTRMDQAGRKPTYKVAALTVLD